MSTRRTIDIDIKNNAGETAKDFDNLSQATNRAAKSVDNLDATFEEVYGELQPLTTRMGEAEDRLYELALAGDTTSKEYQELLTKVGQYRKVQIQTDLAVDSAATTLGQKLGGALTGATSGFAAVQGVMGLVGSESEELEKALLKVQSALAIQQGVQGIREAIPSFKMLGKTAMTALKGIKTGIAATGIGVFVVAIGTLVAYWDDIKEAVSGVSEEQKALTAETEKNVAAANDNLESLNAQENVLKLQGKSEREILQLKIAATDEQIKQLEIQIETNKAGLQGQIEAAERGQQISKILVQVFLNSIALITRLAAAPIDAIIVSLNAASDFLGITEKRIPTINGMLTDLIDNASEAASTFIFDPEQVQKDGEDAIKEQEKTLQGLLNNRAGFELQIQAIDEAAADKAVETEKEKNARLQAEHEKRIDDFKKGIVSMQDAIDEGDQNRLNKLKATMDAEVNINSEANQKILAQMREREAFEALSADRKRELAVGAATDTFSTLSNLAELFAGESKKQQKKAFKVQKAANIAQATVDTFSSAIAAYKSQASIPVVGPVLGGIAAAAAVSAGLLNIKKISQQRFDSGGGTDGGGADFAPSGGGAQAPSFNVVGDSGVNQLAQLQQQPTQAYVVSGEVTTAQALDRNRVQNATL